jgi:hypothetical protein
VLACELAAAIKQIARSASAKRTIIIFCNITGTSSPSSRRRGIVIVGRLNPTFTARPCGQANLVATDCSQISLSKDFTKAELKYIVGWLVGLKYRELSVIDYSTGIKDP